MQYKKIPLSAEDKEIYLEAYIPDWNPGVRRTALLVMPGGGYGQVCADREGEPIALAFLPHNFACFVLHYTVGQKRPFPAQLIEASAAMAHIKDNAEEYGINPDWVFTVGFSAGGHLAGCTGVLWKHPAVYEALDIPYGYNKPCGMMLIYPVTDSHLGSFQNLLCTENPAEEQLAMVRLPALVDEDTAPAFLMHTVNDAVVSVEDSLNMALALARAGHLYEMHIHPDGPHGMALANAVTSGGNPAFENPAIAKWVEQAAAWADNLCK